MSAVPVRRLLLLLLLFFALSMPLAWLWVEWGQARYVHLLRVVLGPVYRAIGLQPQGGGPVAPRLVSLVPFLVLMAITPSIPWRRRWIGALVGTALIVCFHLLLFVVVDASYAVLGRNRRALSRIVPFMLVNDGIPFLIWLFFAREFLRQLVPGLAEGPPRGGGPHSGAGRR
jgi:hypothetical protein